MSSIRGDELVLCSGSRGIWGLEEQRSVDSYELELTEDDTTWRRVDRKGRQYTSSELADRALRWLLDEYGQRQNIALERRRRS